MSVPLATNAAIEAVHYIADRSDPLPEAGEALRSTPGLKRVCEVCATRAHALLRDTSDDPDEALLTLLRFHAIAIVWAADIVEAAGAHVSFHDADPSAGEALVALLTWRLAQGFFPAQRMVGLCRHHVRTAATEHATAKQGD